MKPLLNLWGQNMNDKQIKEQLDGLQVRINEKKEEYKKGLITSAEYYAGVCGMLRANIGIITDYQLNLSLGG